VDSLAGLPGNEELLRQIHYHQLPFTPEIERAVHDGAHHVDADGTLPHPFGLTGTRFHPVHAFRGGAEHPGPGYRPAGP